MHWKISKIYFFYNHVKNGGNASVMGQRNGLSDKDVQKLNSMYKCKTTNTATTISPIRPIRPNAPANRPVLNFLGNLVSGIFQEEKGVNGRLSNTNTNTTEITNSIEWTFFQHINFIKYCNINLPRFVTWSHGLC